jgi:transcriptional regulator with XRE-family HTH domain
MTKPAPTALDIQIGERIRIRRRQLGMSMKGLAEKLEVAYQQVQKYESGANLVSAGRLPCVAKALDVQVGFFYGHDDTAAGVDTAAVASSIGLLAERHAIDLLEYFQGMTLAQRNALLEIARAVAAGNAITEPVAPDDEQAATTRLRKGSLARPLAGQALPIE